MKRILALACVAVLGALAWQVAAKLSADALGIAVGLLFGVLAGLPAAALVLFAGRRRERASDDPPAGRGASALPAYAQHAPQAPVIVLAPPYAPGSHLGGSPSPWQDPYRALPGPVVDMERDQRSFRIVGEGDGTSDEW